MDYVYKHDQIDKRRIGKVVILPSSFHNGPRNTYEKFMDPTCFLQHYGRPDSFITMTSNSKWREIMVGRFYRLQLR